MSDQEKQSPEQPQPVTIEEQETAHQAQANHRPGANGAESPVTVEEQETAYAAFAAAEPPVTPRRDAENGGEPEEQFLEEQEAEAAAAQDDARDKMLRLMAEFDNFRRRSAKEKAQERQRGRRDAAEKILPVYDSITSGLFALKPNDPAREGLEAILKQFNQSLAALSIEQIATKGQPFDPNTMEAIARFPSPEFGEGIVMDESRAGFQDEIGLLRAAQVVVSSGKQ